MGAAVGTPAFMSPEQAAGQLDRLGPTSDVYSLGATLYMLLTSRAPQTANDLGEVLMRVQRGLFPKPRELQPAAPRPLEAVCLKAMALDPADRYQSAQALADDLESWLADEPIAALPDPWTTRTRRWFKRHRVVLTGVTAAALAVPCQLGARRGVAERSEGRCGLRQERRRCRRSRDPARTRAGRKLAHHGPRVANSFRRIE